MGFRYSGTAWDGQKWVAAPAIVTLGKQIEAIRPGTFASDGTVASKGHDQTSPNSDHTVWPKTGSGTVYAIDFTEAGGLSVDAVGEAIRLSKDPRCKYLIHDKRMFSSYATSTFPAWTWRPYTGTNGHIDHGHLSVHHTPALANNTNPWAIGGDEVTTEELIKEIQTAINQTGVTPPLDINGVWDIKTRNRFVAAMMTSSTPGPQGPPGKDGKDGAPATLTITGDVKLP
jgi:hypothetical protein